MNEHEVGLKIVEIACDDLAPRSASVERARRALICGDRRIVIVEGESDFLTAVLVWRHVLAAKFGIWSGSWSNALASRIRDGSEVTIWTDPDSAGDRYAEEILRSLGGRCRVLRAKRVEVAA